SRAPGGRLRVTADDDRYSAVLDRLRVAARVLEGHELTGVRLVRRPQGAHGAYVLLGPSDTLRERNADRLELLGEPADADAERQPSARQHVDRCALLCEDDGVALRKDENARRQAHVAR